jgi:DNA-binding LacI/PurR family transcriptional regulator
MPATLADIAKESKTSISTASRVLAGGAMARRISAATRQRVHEAATKLGYRPNLLARSLRTRRSNTVALMVTDIANPFFGKIASLIEHSLHRHGYSLVLCNSAEDQEREIEYLRLLPQKGIDGLILAPLMKTQKTLREQVPEGLPITLLDRPISGVPSSVITDPDQLSNLLCETLGRNLVRKVALIHGPSHVSTHKRRAEIVEGSFTITFKYEGPAQPETGRQAFIKLAGEQPDAIVCTNQLIAQGVLDAMLEIENPPIIGCFDELPMMHLMPIPIVASCQDIPALAESAVSQLLPQLNADQTQIQNVMLSARAITNRAFQNRQLPKV